MENGEDVAMIQLHWRRGSFSDDIAPLDLPVMERQPSVGTVLPTL